VCCAIIAGFSGCADLGAVRTARTLCVVRCGERQRPPFQAIGARGLANVGGDRELQDHFNIQRLPPEDPGGGQASGHHGADLDRKRGFYFPSAETEVA
jgi:hypothetical protein